MSTLEAWVDGACLGNDRSKDAPGGWAVVLEYRDEEGRLMATTERSGSARPATNNRMELTAVIECLKTLKRPISIKIYTDSRYVVDGSSRCIFWSEMGWVKTDGKTVANIDLWSQIVSFMKTHEIIFEWIRGHNLNGNNIRCDKLAKEAAKGA